MSRLVEASPAARGKAARDRRRYRDRLMNRLVNPFVRVRRILRSPLYDLLGGGIVLVRVRGRRTGKIRTVTASPTAPGSFSPV